MSINIDSKAVLKRLNQLGYYHVTQDKLKEFIQDLKKLIRSEGKKKKNMEPSEPTFDALDKMERTRDSSPSQRNDSPSQRNDSPSQRNESSQRNASSFEMVSARKVDRENIQHCTRQRHDLCECCESRSSGLSTKTSRHSTDFSELKYPLKQNVVRKSCETIPLKPKSSFIRPWRLAPNPHGAGTVQRTDPVALYHYYQSVWKQQKLPGEDKRADLRWSIREIMMGHEVIPRPALQSLSIERVNCKSKKKWQN